MSSNSMSANSMSASSATDIFSLGIVGVRGYVGKELLALISQHPNIHIDWVSSRQLEGQTISSLFDGSQLSVSLPKSSQLITSLSAKQVADKATDIIVLALPNGLAEPFIGAIETSGKAKIIIDLSADYRFDEQWIYSIPELDGKQLRHAFAASQASKKPTIIKISNPGCYATAMQLAIAPIKDLLSASPHCFGISGYSGAGTKPSDFNDAENLKDNLIGYKLVEHIHEKEVTERLNMPVRFSPHVAGFFRGINMTTQFEFKEPQTSKQLLKSFKEFYADHAMVICQSETPQVKQVINTHLCLIGGITVSSDGKRAAIISCLDNLLKGAASQALQNINLALGLASELALIKTPQSKFSHETAHLGEQQ